jgi:hypothetical protein
MSSNESKIVINNDQQRADQNFQRMLENNPHSNIHYYAAGTVVHNYFGKKFMSNPFVSERLEEPLPHLPHVGQRHPTFEERRIA